MKKNVFRQVMAASLTAAMALSLAACGEKPVDNKPADTTPSTTDTTPADTTPSDGPAADDEVSPYPILKDANGNPYDLGGMEIIIRNWWSGERAEDWEPANKLEEDTEAYRQWFQDTYNFKIKELAISGWGDAPQDFVDYASAPDDGNNYVFVIRPAAATTSAMGQGLMYDLSTLDCLDFTDIKHTANKTHELYSKGGAIYGMAAGASEPRDGLFFNKTLLNECGINPDVIYDMQKDGSWTWDAWEDLLKQTTIDKDGDTVNDVWGETSNRGQMLNEVVYSNGGEYVGMENGKYVLKTTAPETVKGLEFAVHILANYDALYGDDAAWDAYKEGFLSGAAVFLPDQEYCIMEGNLFARSERDFDLGFVCMPKGPDATSYKSIWDNNIVCIPANYDADKAWKLAFAWNLYTNDTPGYEGTDDWKTTYYRHFDDTRAVDETLALMRTPEVGFVTYHGVIPGMDLGDGYNWALTAAGGTAVVSEINESKFNEFSELVNAAN